MIDIATFLVALFAFILGTATGSFISVILHRLPQQAPGILLGRSLCFSCKVPLLKRDLIPLISYWLLGRKCRYCKKDLSITYFLIEAVTGLAFLALALFWNPFATGNFSMATFLTLLQWFFYATLLMAMFFYDLKHMEIPDILLMLGLGTALIIAIHSPNIGNALWAIAVPVLFFGAQILLSKGKWLGEGDFYLGIFMGLILGFPNIVVGILLGYLLGTIVAVILLVGKKATPTSRVPFGPFLIAGTFLALFFGDAIIAWWNTFLLI